MNADTVEFESFLQYIFKKENISTRFNQENVHIIIYIPIYLSFGLQNTSYISIAVCDKQTKLYINFVLGINLFG